jgi:sugar/nucleoside kinase (ribokinase family)
MPTEREARVALRNQEDGLVVLLEKLRKESGTNNIILKLGGDGALLSVKEKTLSPQIDRIPALNTSPRDIMGAGDSMLIGASLALALPDTNTWLAGCIGSILAAHQVSQIGNIPLNLDRILQELKD